VIRKEQERKRSDKKEQERKRSGKKGTRKVEK
jgi:hypothetical protein